MTRTTQVIARPGTWFRGRELSAANLQQTNDAIAALSNQVNAGGQQARAKVLDAGLAKSAVVSTIPTFTVGTRSVVNLVRHPSLIGQTAEEYPAIGWFDTFPLAYDIYTYTYTSINTRDSDDGAASIIAEELTPRILVGAIVVSQTIIVDEEVQPGEFESKKTEFWWQPGQWWASETLLGAGLGS